MISDSWKALGEMQEHESLVDAWLRISNKTIKEMEKANTDALLSPFLFSDMSKAIDIIENAITQQKRILIFGDYDVDGISGTAQLYLALKTVGALVSYRLPCRADGYGLSEKFIDEAHENNVSVFITTDCGISSFHEITKAKSLGMQVIITDHHSVPAELPPADAMIHPLLPHETFPDKHLTGSGVAWYLCYGLFLRFFPTHAMSLALELLELAVLGTVADCGVLSGQNRIITQLGIDQLSQSKNKGLQKLIEISGSKSNAITPETIGFYLAPRINASGRLAHPRIALELLLGNEERAKELNTLNQERQQMLDVFIAEALEKISNPQHPAIIVSAAHWTSGLIGLISGRLAEQFGKPVIVFEEGPEKITGSCRGPEDFHIAKTLKQIKAQHPEIFIGCGGHAQAAGLSIYPKYFDLFCDLYQEAVKKERGENPPAAYKKYICEIKRSLSIEEISTLWNIGQPFGVGNPTPLFVWQNAKIVFSKSVGSDHKHLSLLLDLPFHTSSISAIWFRGGEYIEKFKKGDSVCLLATPEIKEWNGQKSIGLKIIDMC